MRGILPKLTVLAVAGTVLLSGCASIVSKTSYPVYMHVTPAGANISITDKKGKEVYRGQSPGTVTLKSGSGFFSKAEYQVKISAPGYHDKIVPINFNLNGWYFGNILIGGVIGMLIVDPATGAMWKLKDPLIDETLVRTNATAATLNVVDIKNVSAEEKSNLIRIK